MDCLDRFNKRMRLSGGSLRNENINNSRKLLESTFEDDASFTFGIYMWELDRKTYENQTPIKIRLFNRTFSAANGWTEKFQTLIDTEILVGDIVYDSNEDIYLICTEVFNVDNIHYEGKFTLCNWILKWQDKETGRIFEYPCHEINSTQYNSGENFGDVFTYGSSQHQVTLPADEYTVEIDTPQRFFLDKGKKNPTSFVVTQNDTTSWLVGKKGVVKVTLKECAMDNDADRPDLGICDYVDINDIKKDNDDTVVGEIAKSVIKFSSNIIKSGGSSQWFSAKFYDDNNNEVTGITPVWNIICDFKNKLEVIQSDDKLIIGIDNDEYVDEEFKIELSNESGEYLSSVIVRIESLL